LTLDDYRKKKNWSYGQLAHLLDAGHAQMARRWCLPMKHKDRLVPRQRYMSRIIELTKGEVQPNDFFIERG
tara:strand:- start:441 stop:653 length:213 start_codon:yes stop_codon:yes gene_type:complete